MSTLADLLAHLRIHAFDLPPPARDHAVALTLALCDLGISPSQSLHTATAALNSGPRSLAPNPDYAARGAEHGAWARTVLDMLAVGPCGRDPIHARVEAAYPGAKKSEVSCLLHHLLSRGTVCAADGKPVLWSLALGDPLGHPLGTPLGHPLGHPLGNPLGNPLGAPKAGYSGAPRSPDEWVEWIADQLSAFPDQSAYDAEIVSRANREFGAGTVRQLELRWNDASDKAGTIKDLVPLRGVSTARYRFADTAPPPMRDMLPVDARNALVFVEEDTD